MSHYKLIYNFQSKDSRDIHFKSLLTDDNKCEISTITVPSTSKVTSKTTSISPNTFIIPAIGKILD